VVARAQKDREDRFILYYVYGISDDNQPRQLTWLRENDLLPRNPDGSFVDIPYAYDLRAGRYSLDAKLSDYLDSQGSI